MMNTTQMMLKTKSGLTRRKDNMPTSENTEQPISEDVLVNCYDCDESFDEGDTYVSPCDEEHRCEACHHDIHGYCEDCASECWADNMVYVDARSEDVCEDCAYHYSECDACGESHHEDDMTYDDNSGDNYCESCYEHEASRSNEINWEVMSEDFIKTHKSFVGLHYAGDNMINPRFEQQSIIKSERPMGIEIETNFNESVDNSDLRDYLIGDLLDARREQDIQYRNDRVGLNVTYDGSVTGGEHQYGSEVIMEPRRSSVLEHDMRLVTDLLKTNMGAYISRKCGYHLHVDSRDYDWYHFAVLLLMTKVIEPHIYSWVPSSRSNGQWCRPVSQPINAFRYIDDRDSFVDFYYDDGGFNFDRYHSKRYHGLNLHSHFGANSGIELRYHSGTLNAEKMIHWSNLWGCIIDKCYKLGNEVRTEMRDNNLYGFHNTEMYKSLTNTGIDDIISRDEKSHYWNKYRQKDRNENGYLIIDGDYVLDESILNKQLNLDKNKFYSIQPLIRQIDERIILKKPCMTINSMFDYFEIPTATQDFYRMRSVELTESQEGHIKKCFNDVTTFIEFKDGKFTHRDLLLKRRLPTVSIIDDYDDNNEYTQVEDASIDSISQYLLLS